MSGLSLPPSHRLLIEPCGTQLSSEFVSGPTNLSVNPKLQDVDVSEAVHFLSPRLGFIFHNEIFKGSFVKTSLCILLKMGEPTVLFFPQSSPWVLALRERFAWKCYSQGMKPASDSGESPHPLCFKLWKYLCLPEMAFLKVFLWLCWYEYIAFCLTRTGSVLGNFHVRHKGDRNLQYKLWMVSSNILKIHITITG